MGATMTNYKINPDFSTEKCDDMLKAWESKEKYPLNLRDDIDGLWVSTVFLVIDHAFHPDSKYPMIFETMVFDNTETGDGGDIYMSRYSSYNMAKYGHERIVERIKQFKQPKAIEWLK